MKHIIYDTDMIGDDILTLAVMLCDQNVSLDAVTTYGRRIGALKRAEIAKRVINHLSTHPVDIIPGASVPLLCPAHDGCRYCDMAIDTFMAEPAPLSSMAASKNYATLYKNIHAAEYIIQKTRENPGMYSLLCTGPLTNIALALSIDPTLPERLEKVVVMGGLWNECGNSSAVAEANMYNDPEAARIVFDRMPNIITVGLDVTLRVCAEKSHMQAIGKTSIGMLLQQLTHRCCDVHDERSEGSRMPLHDVLAFYVLTDESLVTTKKCTIHVETRSTLASGMTVCDFEQTDMNHQFAITVDASRVLTRFKTFIDDFSALEATHA